MALLGTPIQLTGNKQWFSFGCYRNNDGYVTLDIIQNDGKVVYLAASFEYDQNRKIS